MEYEFDKYTKVQLVVGDVLKDNELEFSAHITCVPEQDAQIFVSKIRITKRHSIAQARIVQKGEERVRVLGNFTTFDTSNPATTVRRPFPGSPIENCKRQELDPVLLPNFSRVECVMEEGSRKIWTGGSENSGVVASYLRFIDGREIDIKGISYFADVLYPTPFNITEFGSLVGTWVPTLELTVQYFAVPAPGYVYAYNKCTEVVNGTVGIEGSLWDSQKRLVAITRQTALLGTMSIIRNKL